MKHKFSQIKNYKPRIFQEFYEETKLCKYYYKYRCVVSLIGMTSNLTLANPIVFNRSSFIRVHTENTFLLDINTRRTLELKIIRYYIKSAWHVPGNYTKHGVSFNIHCRGYGKIKTNY